MTLKKYQCFQKMLSKLLSKCTFKAPLIGPSVLRSMIHVISIFVEYQIGSIAGHSLEAIT